MGEGAVLRLRLPPMDFDAAFGIDAPDDSAAVPDDEDESDASEGDAGHEGSDDEGEDLDDDE
jgi:hypothetical protein